MVRRLATNARCLRIDEFLMLTSSVRNSNL